MKDKIIVAKSIIQLKSREQDKIFEDLIKEMGEKGKALEDDVFDYCYNGFETRKIKEYLDGNV